MAASVWQMLRLRTSSPIEKPMCGVGDLIYDPFAGSCSTLKVAKAMNRNCKGSELSKEYCQLYADYETGLLL